MAMAKPSVAVAGIWREMREIEREEPRRRFGGPVAQFALSGIGAVVLLGAAGVYLLQHIGRTEAIRDAKQVAQLAGRGVVEPYVTPALERGDPRAIAALDRAVRSGVLGNRLVRVKLWLPSGKIVYSDEHRLIGTRYPLQEDELAAFRSSRTAADISDLRQPENRFERRFGKLLEVYLPIRDSRGRPVLFETYARYSSVAASGRRLWLAFAPAILGVLAVLWLVQLPLAWRAARRLRQGQIEREALLNHAIEASELERRRIARDLHDGAVQHLAGVSYSLTAAADRVEQQPPEQTADVMRDAAARTLLVDLYPPDLHRAGLEAALRDLVEPLASRGIESRLELPERVELPPRVETLFYRCAQEALRNVVSHSRAKHVVVRVECDGHVRLTVEDDGVGLPEETAKRGHLGLRLLDDLARESSGSLEVESAPGAGTRVSVEVPR
jgi:signal transduction histidine kinase